MQIYDFKEEVNHKDIPNVLQSHREEWDEDFQVWSDVKSLSSKEVSKGEEIGRAGKVVLL